MSTVKTSYDSFKNDIGNGCIIITVAMALVGLALIAGTVLWCST